MKCPILKGWQCIGPECRFFDEVMGKCLFYKFFREILEELEEEEE